MGAAPGTVSTAPMRTKFRTGSWKWGSEILEPYSGIDQLSFEIFDYKSSMFGSLKDVIIYLFIF